ncbi:MAG: tRNA (adenosine(37)-N6)-threonylcarbamoyltransferase complex ATPase subunit type 1 TsaE [Desulfamplus sp.]|nr:tRNA (adenosine(37)-N6)-threonylcarbamoyltransferase complex ATPase subunit type 1 TsaE [Desulfamplus sp.]
MNSTQNTITIKTFNDHETREAGRKLGSLIRSTNNTISLNHEKEIIKKTQVFDSQHRRRIAIALYGGLGAGKTTFVQGFAKGLGVPEQYYVTSPTYNIINEYPTEKMDTKNSLMLYHMDLYRLGSPDELEYIGFDDIAASNNSVIIIEWPDIIDETIIKFDLTIHITTDQDFNRKISFIPSGLEGSNLLNQLAV